MKIINYFLETYWKGLTIVGWITITYYSIYPLPALPPLKSTPDYLHHFVAYMIFALPVSYAKPKKYIYILLAMVVWSLTMELIQPYVNRYGELSDFLANCGGITLGYLIGSLFSKVINKN